FQTLFYKLFYRQALSERLAAELRRLRRFVEDPAALPLAEGGHLVEGDPEVEVFDPQPVNSAARPSVAGPVAALLGFGLGAAAPGPPLRRLGNGLLGAASAALGATLTRWAYHSPPQE